jgi:hypothetical protein
MRSRKSRAIPARLEAGRRRFEQWRRTRKGQARIPESLWTSAVKLADAYGLCRTAQTLRLDYNALKRRLTAMKPDDPSGPETATAFVELPPLRFRQAQHQPGAGLPECVIELEHAGGAKMRIHLQGADLPDLAALSGVFWGSEA